MEPKIQEITSENNEGNDKVLFIEFLDQSHHKHKKNTSHSIELKNKNKILYSKCKGPQAQEIDKFDVTLIHNNVELSVV
jgi:hypothetical protein